MRGAGCRIGQKEKLTCSAVTTVWSSGTGLLFEFSHAEARGLHPGRGVPSTWAVGNSEEALSHELSAGKTPGKWRMSTPVLKRGPQQCTVPSTTRVKDAVNRSC